MRRRRALRAVFLSLAGFSLAACHVGENPRAEVIDPDSASRVDIRATMDAYASALRQGDPDVLASFFTPDAQLAEPGMNDIEGANAIRTAFQSFYGNGGVVTEVDVETDAVYVDGADAFEFGSFAEKFRMAEGDEQTVRGRYAIQWRRGVEARWRIRRFLLNHLPPDTAAAETAAADTAAR